MSTFIKPATDFDIRMFQEMAQEKDPAVLHHYIQIFLRKKITSSLFLPELQKPEYEKGWSKYLGHYFAQYPIEKEHKELCEWILPIMMSQHLEHFRSLSTYQKDNAIFKEIYKEAKKNVGDNMTQAQFIASLKKITKLKDLEIISKALDNNPGLATPETQKESLAARYLQNWDSGERIAKIFEKLHISTDDIVTHFFPTGQSSYHRTYHNFTKLSFYWAKKIFSGSDISEERKQEIISTYFSQRHSYGKPAPEKHFLTRFYYFVEAYKTAPKTLVVMVPAIQTYLKSQSQLSAFHKLNSPSDNPFLWLLNFLQKHGAQIDASLSSSQASSKLQKTLIQLEEKNLMKEIKKTKPLKQIPGTEVKKKFKI